MNPDHWIKMIEEHRITIWNSVPALMKILLTELETMNTTHMLPLRCVLLSGDWIPVNMPSQIKEIVPMAKINCLGGATEASIWSINHEFCDERIYEKIPYGKPLSNQAMDVCNEDGESCPVCYINTVYSNSLASEIKKTERYIKRQENVASKMQQQILNIRCSQELLSKLNFSLKCKKEYHPLLLEELLDLRTESEIENIFDNFSQEYIQYSVEMRKKILAQTILFYMNKKGVLLKDIPCTLNQILKCLSVNTDNNDIIYRWIELLKKYNYVTETDGIYVCKIEIYEKGLKYGWEEVEYLWKGKLESPLVLDYIINNIKNWDKLIQKEQQATLLLFEQGEDIYADALYKETKILQYLNHSLSKKVLGYLYENANATILEIGAGTGATSDKVLSDIRENKFEEHIVYFYTDISRFFLQRAKERYKECDGKIEMHYQTLDIDEAFSSQLPSNFQADIVIAVGVLNNSVNTDKCIYEINSVMKPGGILLIIETVEDVPDILITQSFMMTEPKDQRKATNTMFLNRKQWLEILEENGFCNSEEFPGYGEYLEVLGQKLFYCTKE